MRIFLSLMCRLVRILAQLELGSWLQPWVNRAFVRFFGINMSEALETDPASYRSVQHVFTRALRSGVRPVKGIYCSPSDGILLHSGPTDANTVIVAKGISYRLDELVHGICGRKVDVGWSSVFYLAPHNYHRVHSPLSGTIQSIRHLPGNLWPVSPRTLSYIPNLYSTNERLVFQLALDGFEHPAFVVMVGALNVTTMSTKFWPELNDKRSLFLTSPQTYIPAAGGNRIGVGEELGIFELGSTVVTVLPAAFVERHSLLAISNQQPILVGHSLINE